MIIFTDGAYSSSRDQGGIGIVFVNNDQIVTSFGKMYRHVSNNKMELLAVIITIQTILKNDLGKSFTIVTDSQYVIGCATQGWKRNKNKKLWAKYDKLKEQLDLLNINIQYQWVKGHNGDPFNELADQLAVEASHEIIL